MNSYDDNNCEDAQACGAVNALDISVRHTRRNVLALGAGLLAAGGTAWALSESGGASPGRLRDSLIASPQNVNSLAFSPNGNLLAAANSGSELTLWDVASASILWTINDLAGAPFSLDFTRDGTSIIGADEGIRVWGVETGLSLSSSDELGAHGSQITVVSLSPDGLTAASGDDQGSLWFWDTASWHAKFKIAAHSDAVSSVQFSPNGRLLASGSWDGTARIWDAHNGNAISKYIAVGRVDKVIFDAASSTIFTIVGNAVDRVSAASGRTILSIPVFGARVNDICLSPDGRMLAAADATQMIHLWDVAADDFSASWNTAGAPYCLSWGGDVIASGEEDGIVELWNAVTR